MSAALIAALERDLADRAAAGLARSRRIVDSPQGPRVIVDGRELVAFASNDYLGLAEPSGADRGGRATAAIALGRRRRRIASRLRPLSPRTPRSKHELAAFVAPCAGARALTFSSGYLANLAILTALAGRGDAIFADRLNHACLNDGALLSRAEFVRYAHGDVAALRARLAASTAPRKLIATDAVFSMDGDLAPLPALLALAEEFDAWLVVDDAHGFGVLGEGRGIARALRARVRAHRAHGHARQGGGRRRARSSPRIRRSSRRWCRRRARTSTRRRARRSWPTRCARVLR